MGEDIPEKYYFHKLPGSDKRISFKELIFPFLKKIGALDNNQVLYHSKGIGQNNIFIEETTIPVGERLL